MALKKRGKFRYGDSHVDIREELFRYSTLNSYPAQHFAEALCKCGGTRFRLAVDDAEGVAVRTCDVCGGEHPIGDSGEYLDDAELSVCACPCDCERFEITIGVALYDSTEDVRWLYLGCRCPACGITAVYADWKVGGGRYDDLLSRV